MFNLKYKPAPGTSTTNKGRVVKMLCPLCQERMEWEYNCPSKCPKCGGKLPFYERLINSTTETGFRVRFYLEKSV